MAKWICGCVLGLALSGCAGRVGARAMPEVRFHYNEAVAVSSNEQLLLNLVRIRFNHTVQFLEPTNVVTNWSITRNGAVGANPTAGGGNPLSVLGAVSAGVSATESPTITYQPLSGERFVRLMAQPIGPDLVLRLIQSGWEADLVLRLTTDQVNDLPSPWNEPNDFDRVLQKLAELQRARHLLVVLDGGGASLGLHDDADVSNLLELLGLPENTRRLSVTGRGFDRANNQLALATRSLLSTLFHASLGVEVSPDDPTALDYDGPAAPLLRVQSGPTVPAGRAYVRVSYRGQWYWIDDADLASKRTFSLLSLLFSLMAAPDAAGIPMLTVPTGR